eukprot:403365973
MLQNNKMLFDKLYEEKFKFQTVRQTQYENITPISCEVFDDLTFIKNFEQEEKSKQCKMGIIEGGILIIFTNEKLAQFQEVNQNDSQMLNQTVLLSYKFLDINFCYLDYQRSKAKKSTKNLDNVDQNIIGEVLILQRNGWTYKITNLQPEQIKIWKKVLNRYVIRMDQPLNYHVLDKLGKGANAVVYKAEKIQKNIDNILLSKKVIFALKVFEKEPILHNLSTITLLRDEIAVHRQLKQCHSALQLFKVYESCNKLYLVLEYQEGGSLLNLVKSGQTLSEKNLQTIFGQILLGLDFMHSQNIIHRDIKLDNILLSSSNFDILELRLADFGLAKVLKEGELCYHKCGTPTYIAPEILRGEGYTQKADLFSLGSVLFNLVSGQFLFSSHKPNMMLAQNRECDLRHVQKMVQNLSSEGQDLMMKLLDPNQKRRFDAKQALNHRWFLQDKDALMTGLKINYQLMNTNIQKKSMIHTALMKDFFLSGSRNSLGCFQQQSPDLAITKNQMKNKKLTASNMKIGSFFFERKSSDSLSKAEDSGNSKESVNYYNIIEQYRRRPLSQKPIKIRSIVIDQNFEADQNQYLNLSNQKFRELQRGQSVDVHESYKCEEIKINNNRKQSLFKKKAIKECNKEFNVKNNDQNFVIKLEISNLSSDSQKDIDSLSEEWNVSNYQADEQIERDSHSDKKVKDHNFEAKSNNQKLAIDRKFKQRIFIKAKSQEQ